jgi:flagellar motor switch protein FliN
MMDGPIERLAERIATECASRLGARLGDGLRADEVAVAPAGADIFAERSFPLVVVTLPYQGEGAGAGESLVLLDPAAARAVLLLLGNELEDEAELGEPELAAIAAIAAELIDGAAAALGAELGIALTIDAPSARLAAAASELRTPDSESLVLTYRLLGEVVSLELAQTLPAMLGAQLAAASDDEPIAEQVADVADTIAPDDTVAPEDTVATDDAVAPDGADDATLRAVEWASGISADAATEVLSELFSEELSAATPTVSANPNDPLTDHEYPLIVGDLSYVTGLEGSIRFCLLPADAAQLAAAMMGTPETTGDGLSAIELSAVSEALHQVMAATAHGLARRLGTEVEISPPTCVVVDSAEQARERIGETAYRASFRFASTVFGAEITQYVSPELARSLGEMLAIHEGDGSDDFSISDLGDAFAGVLLEGVPENPEVGDGRAGAREILSGIRVRVSAELGRAKLPIGRVANLPGGSVVMLDRAPTDPVDVLVNGTPFAQAKMVLVDGEYAVQILSLSPFDRPG